MSSHTQQIVYLQDWLSDPWFARDAANNAIGIAPIWAPPASLTGWRSGGEATAAATGQPYQLTNHAAFQQLLAANADSQAAFDPEAIPTFDQRESEIQQQGDARMIQGEIVRAWLDTAVGPMLMGILLTPPQPAMSLAVAQRLRIPQQFEFPSSWVNDFEERRLEMLYNWSISSTGDVVQSTIHNGQGERWREHWGWLSAPLSTPEVLDSVQLAARLLRSPIVAEVLAVALQSPDESLQHISLCVFRRWLLALKAMAWLEAALVHPWQHTRPQDLSCFACNALKPDWPPRRLASAIAPATSSPPSSKWLSGKALTAPSTPATSLVGDQYRHDVGTFRIATRHRPHRIPRYRDSVWCLREIEVIDYLRDHADFLAGRAILDVPAASLPQLDRLTTLWSPQQTEIPSRPSAPSGRPHRCPPGR